MPANTLIGIAPFPPAAAYASAANTLKDIADHSALHYSLVSKIVRNAE
jgi:hypothetical protein